MYISHTPGWLNKRAAILTDGEMYPEICHIFNGDALLEVREESVGKKKRGLSCFTINSSEWMALFKSISIGRTPESPLKTLPETDCIAESGP